MKIINKKKSKSFLIIIFSLSISLLSLYLMIGNITNISKLITLLVSFIVTSKYLSTNYQKIINKITTNKIYSIISILFTSIIFYELTLTIYESNIINRFYNLKAFYYLIIPGLYLVITISFINIKNWLTNFFKNLDNLDKKIYLFTSIILFILITIVYSQTNYFYTQFDEIYSIDSGYVYENFVPDPHYYDVRHPITSILVFPIYALINFLFNIQLQPIIIQFINIQLLILTGFELKKLLHNNRIILIFYLLSFPTLLFSLFYEKYPLIIFLMVTYLYNKFINKSNSHLTLTLAIGTMISSFFIAFTELYDKISIKEKISKINEIAIFAILFIIITGRIHCFTGFVNDIKELNFKTAGLTITEKFISTTKMIEHSIIALPSSQHIFISYEDNPKDIYRWNNVTSNPSIIAIIILLIIILGIKNLFTKKTNLTYPLIITVAFSFILFIILNWAVTESPLFSIYFSWALIPLFVLGFEEIFNFLKINKQYHKYLYLSIIIIITYININGFIDMYHYISTH